MQAGKTKSRQHLAETKRGSEIAREEEGGPRGLNKRLRTFSAAERAYLVIPRHLGDNGRCVHLNISRWSLRAGSRIPLTRARARASRRTDGRAGERAGEGWLAERARRRRERARRGSDRRARARERKRESERRRTRTRVNLTLSLAARGVPPAPRVVLPHRRRCHRECPSTTAAAVTTKITARRMETHRRRNNTLPREK